MDAFLCEASEGVGKLERMRHLLLIAAKETRTSLNGVDSRDLFAGQNLPGAIRSVTDQICGTVSAELPDPFNVDVCVFGAGSENNRSGATYATPV